MHEQTVTDSFGITQGGAPRLRRVALPWAVADAAPSGRRYPQQRAQTPGVGLPIARAVAIVSLATACVMDLAF